MQPYNWFQWPKYQYERQKQTNHKKQRTNHKGEETDSRLEGNNEIKKIVFNFRGISNCHGNS